MSDAEPKILTCTRCGTDYRVKEYDPARSYRCRQCSGALSTKSQAKARTSAPLEEALPEEVYSAQSDPARRFGRFVLLDLLGRGGMGVVHKAWDLELGRYVAIKQIAGEEDEAEALRFRREAKIAARLEHPNIAPVYDVGSQDGNYFIVMKYIDGVTLHRIEEKHPGRLIQYFLQACQGVAYAHENGIIHRDLKPQNIMIDRQGAVFVLDFGIARSTSMGGGVTLTASGGLMGTPAYMSPEQAQGRMRELDVRSDIFSLGATLWAILAGRPPHEAENLQEMIFKIATETPGSILDIRPDVPKEIDAVLRKAMSLSPDDRHPSVAAFAAELERASRQRIKAGRRFGMQSEPTTEEAPPARPPGLATASLATGISGIVLACVLGPWSLPISIGAIVAGFISLRRIDKQPERTGRGTAIAGILCGLAAFLVGLLSFLQR